MQTTNTTSINRPTHVALLVQSTFQVLREAKEAKEAAFQEQWKLMKQVRKFSDHVAGRPLLTN